MTPQNMSSEFLIYFNQILRHQPLLAARTKNLVLAILGFVNVAQGSSGGLGVRPHQGVLLFRQGEGYSWLEEDSSSNVVKLLPLRYLGQSF
jgi:hypothetical protein